MAKPKPFVGPPSRPEGLRDISVWGAVPMKEFGKRSLTCCNRSRWLGPAPRGRHPGPKGLGTLAWKIVPHEGDVIGLFEVEAFMDLRVTRQRQPLTSLYPRPPQGRGAFFLGGENIIEPPRPPQTALEGEVGIYHPKGRGLQMLRQSIIEPIVNAEI